MDRDNWAVTEMGRKVSGPEYLAGVEALNRYARKVAAWWAGGSDLLVTLLEILIEKTARYRADLFVRRSAEATPKSRAEK